MLRALLIPLFVALLGLGGAIRPTLSGAERDGQGDAVLTVAGGGPLALLSAGKSHDPGPALRLFAGLSAALLVTVALAGARRLPPPPAHAPRLMAVPLVCRAARAPPASPSLLA